jgi:hypothetical protein
MARQRARDSRRNQVPVLVEERQSASPPYLSVCRIKGKRKTRKRELAATPQDTSSLNCRQRAGQAVQRHSTGHRKKECAKRPRIWHGERSTSKWPALCSPSRRRASDCNHSHRRSRYSLSQTERSQGELRRALPTTKVKEEFASTLSYH